MTGGILAELQGGQFGHGFLAAGLTKAVMGRFSYHDGSAPAVLSRTTIAAIVGGTVSRITGGKFANGAMTAAMAQLFNAEAHNAARLNRKEQLAHLVVRTTEDSILYEYGDASVLVMNDVPGNGIPVVNMQQVEHVLDVSYEVNKQVQIISGIRSEDHPLYRAGSPHASYRAIDVRIAGYSSEQVANALHGSKHFSRVASYTDGRTSAHADYKPSSHSRFRGRLPDQAWIKVYE